ncbi:MAG TPA: hypothetical protein VF088_02645 [Pyrinomonadaceae bacterium]
MVKTGMLEIDHNSGVSRLNSGPGDRKRLAKDEGEGDPFANATEFLEDERGLDDGDFIFVTGENGTHSGVAVIFITDAGLAEHVVDVITAEKAGTPSSAMTDRAAAKKRRPTKKPGKKRSNKAAKKGSKKSGKKANKK